MAYIVHQKTIYSHYLPVDELQLYKNIMKSAKKSLVKWIEYVF